MKCGGSEEKREGRKEGGEWTRKKKKEGKPQELLKEAFEQPNRRWREGGRDIFNTSMSFLGHRRIWRSSAIIPFLFHFFLPSFIPSSS
jgi:hypothetical protein